MFDVLNGEYSFWGQWQSHWAFCCQMKGPHGYRVQPKTMTTEWRPIISTISMKKTMDLLFSSFLAANHVSTPKVLFRKRGNLPCCFMHSHAITDPLTQWPNDPNDHDEDVIGLWFVTHFSRKFLRVEERRRRRSWSWIDLDRKMKMGTFWRILARA